MGGFSRKLKRHSNIEHKKRLDLSSKSKKQHMPIYDLMFYRKLIKRNSESVTFSIRKSSTFAFAMDAAYDTRTLVDESCTHLSFMPIFMVLDDVVFTTVLFLRERNAVKTEKGTSKRRTL